ncbi:MAG: tyrosine-type recombinase/integrase [Rhodanobacter sp.]
MGRVRTKSRAGWPDNLYPNRDGFKYRHPDTKKETWMGKDRARAFEAARKLNALLAKGNDLVDRVVMKTETITQAVALFREEDMPGRNWAPKTASVYESVLNRIESNIGDREVAAFTVRDCADFMKKVTESPRSRQQFRLVLTWVLACAVEEGWIETNPAIQTRKAVYKRKRDRLTKPVYDAIWAVAEPWLRNAMDLSLVTLLRREDIAASEFADAHDGSLWIMPGKTEGITGVRIKIKIEGSLSDIISRCRDDVLSPYLIHRLPERARSQEKRAKERRHHTQVLPEQISRAFADARAAAGIESKNPPTFHEIRSLGGALLRKSGWTLEQVQALMTHTSPSMTEHYLEGHETPWTDVSIGLSLKR